MIILFDSNIVDNNTSCSIAAIKQSVFGSVALLIANCSEKLQNDSSTFFFFFLTKGSNMILSLFFV